MKFLLDLNVEQAGSARAIPVQDAIDAA